MATVFMTVNVVINAIFSIGGILGNSMIIYAFLRTKSLQTVNNVFLFMLAIADLIKSLLILPVKTYNQHIGERRIPAGVCELSGFTVVMLTLLTIGLLDAIAFVRYYKIVQWAAFDRVFSRRRMQYYCVAVLVFPTILGLLPIIGVGKYTYSRFHGVCFANWSDGNVLYRVLLYVYIIIIGYTVLIFCYGKIFYTLRRHSKRLKPKSTRGDEASKSKQNGASMKINQGYGSVDGEKSETSFTESQSTNEVGQLANESMVTKKMATNLSPISEQNGPSDISYEMKSTDSQASTTEKFNDDSSKEVQNEKRKRRRPRKRGFSRKEVQITKVMFAVVLAYALSWLPALLTTVLKLANLLKLSPEFVYIMVTLVDMMVFLNPLIYGFWNKQFRDAIKESLSLPRVFNCFGKD
eukprot:Seg1526.8 transcript_id=Seg1526.8/GoldUCD/mRNA.D3Y31 product=Melanopsin protein_id=Seg1526.8/GoldUCD/D3Y31